VLRGNTSIGLDSLKTQGNLSANEIVCPSAQAEYTYYVPPGKFAGQTENYYIGTLVRGGSFSSVCVTVPILRCNGFGNVKQEVAKLLTFLGVGQ